MISKVKVLHAILHKDKWLKVGDEVDMDTAAARSFESTGCVDILSTDGKQEVWGSCCAGEHDHGH